jgi:hypothetical protein
MLVRLRRSFVVLLFAVAATIALIPAGTASAAWGCSANRMIMQGVVANCQGGSYAVAGRCRNWLGYSAYIQGPRTSAPWSSIAWCPSGYWVDGNAWILHYS